jgi:alpha-mannosidase
VHPTSQHQGPLPQEFSFLQIKPESLIISALKKGELKNSLILRVYNPESKQTEVEVYTHKKIMNAYLVNLYEKKNKDLGKRIDIIKNRIRFKIKSSQIITLRLDF